MPDIHKRKSSSKQSFDAEGVDIDFLREEYFHLQMVLENYDQKSLLIKAWSVSLCMMGIGASFLFSEPIILLLASLSALLFWYIEALWKAFQYAYYPRVFEIERYFSGKFDKPITSPHISNSWTFAWQKMGVRGLAEALIWPHVFLPHGLLFFGGIVLFIIMRLTEQA